MGASLQTDDQVAVGVDLDVLAGADHGGRAHFLQQRRAAEAHSGGHAVAVIDRRIQPAVALAEVSAAFADACAVQRAIDLARRQTEAHPDRTEAWYLLGVLHQGSQDLKAADACLAEVQQRDLTHTDGLLLRAQIQAGWGHATDALWLLQQVLNQQPGLPAAQGLMAQVLIDLQRTTEARRLLLPMLREAPRQSELWRLLAVARLQGGHRAAGLRALERSLQDRFGLVAAGGATEAGVPASDYLLLVEPIAWQLYHRSAFSDPAYAYAMKATLFEMPARKPLASRGCSDHNWGAVGKRPFLLGYFGDDAAAFRADVDRSHRACAAELIEKMLPPGAPAGN